MFIAAERDTSEANGKASKPDVGRKNSISDFAGAGRS